MKKEPVRLTAIHLHGDGPYVVVSVEFEGAYGEFVEVMREHSGHPEVVAFSHIVEAAGMRRVQPAASVEEGERIEGWAHWYADNPGPRNCNFNDGTHTVPTSGIHRRATLIIHSSEPRGETYLRERGHPRGRRHRATSHLPRSTRRHKPHPEQHQSKTRNPEAPERESPNR